MISKEILEDLERKDFCRLKGAFKLTKTLENDCDALIRRDRGLEAAVERWVEQRCGRQEIFRRYQAYDPELNDFSPPLHFAGRVMAGVGSICSGRNIFMFFPSALGQNPNGEVFGIEFVDVWENIFRSLIFPIVQRSFTPETAARFWPLHESLPKTVYLASVFHEIGHRVGPYRVSPAPRVSLKLNEHLIDILGELSTDSLLVSRLPEFPEIAAFVVLQRLFWFGRKGFRDDPLRGDLNSDNDCWIGSLLWQRLRCEGLLRLEGGRLDLDMQGLPLFFAALIAEIDSLFAPSLSTREQQERVEAWRREQVPFAGGKYQLPPEFRHLLGDLQELPETPHFQTAYPYSQIDVLMEVLSHV